MTRKQKHLLTRILVAAVLFLAGSLLHLPEYVEMGVFLVCYAVVGWDIVWKAITNILHGQVFDENFLMTIATIGALIFQDWCSRKGQQLSGISGSCRSCSL